MPALFGQVQIQQYQVGNFFVGKIPLSSEKSRRFLAVIHDPKLVGYPHLCKGLPGQAGLSRIIFNKKYPHH